MLIRETLTASVNDLLLLLQQFSSINIYYNCIYSNPLSLPLNILCTDFREINVLIKHLETILTYNLESNTLSFLIVKKVIKGNLEEFNKTTLKPSKFLFNKREEYIESFKNLNVLEEMDSDIEKLIIVKTMILASQHFIPKPEHLPYISFFLHLKKIKVGDDYIDIHSNIKREEGNSNIRNWYGIWFI